MGNRLYVGNLAYSTMDQQLQEAFSEFGEVTTVMCRRNPLSR